MLSGVYPVLVQADVRGVLQLQRHRPPQHAHRHDVQLIQQDQREVRQVSQFSCAFFIVYNPLVFVNDSCVSFAYILQKY